VKFESLEGRKELVQKLIGRLALPGCGAVQIHVENSTVRKAPLKDAMRRVRIREA
jgi:hypothetical protein